MITGSTRVFALLGRPVTHSLSPAMHNAAFAHEGLDAVYVALDCAPVELPGLMRGLALAGGGGNVTVPHKAIAAAALDRATDAVRRTEACNTWWLDDGRVCGDNTDVAGFTAAIARLPVAEAPRVLLIGAGGAARAVVASLHDRNASVRILNRSRERARRVARLLDPGRARVSVANGIDEVLNHAFDLVVNATSLGMASDDAIPIDLDRLRHAGAVVDLVYRRGGTRWVDSARALGIPAIDGLPMLLGQGAAAFERWWNRPAPTEVMKSALPH